jgi:hypothetical protein
VRRPVGAGPGQLPQRPSQQRVPIICFYDTDTAQGISTAIPREWFSGNVEQTATGLAAHFHVPTVQIRRAGNVPRTANVRNWASAV